MRHARTECPALSQSHLHERCYRSHGSNFLFLLDTLKPCYLDTLSIIKASAKSTVLQVALLVAKQVPFCKSPWWQHAGRPVGVNHHHAISWKPKPSTLLSLLAKVLGGPREEGWTLLSLLAKVDSSQSPCQGARRTAGGTMDSSQSPCQGARRTGGGAIHSSQSPCQGARTAGGTIHSSQSPCQGARDRGRNDGLFSVSLPRCSADRGRMGNPLFSVSSDRGRKGAPLFSVSSDRGRKGAPLFSVSSDRGRKGAPLFSVSSDRGRKGAPLFSVSSDRGRKGLHSSQSARTGGGRALHSSQSCPRTGGGRALHSSQSPCHGLGGPADDDVVAAHAQCKVEASEHSGFERHGNADTPELKRRPEWLEKNWHK